MIFRRTMIMDKDRYISKIGLQKQGSIELVISYVFLASAMVMVASAMSGDEQTLDPTSFVYADFQEELQDLRLLGDARFVRIDGKAEGMAVQLSGTAEHTVGRLLYGIPVNMLDRRSGLSASFSTFFSFSMSAWGGDGLAFVIVPDKTSIGASGQWLGLIEQEEITTKRILAPNTFAIEFDSVMNEDIQDPNSNHVGVDVESIVSEVTANASEISVTLNDGTQTFAWIDYDAYNMLLEVRIGKSIGEKPVQALLTHKVNLAKVWKKYMFVGFSSSTGNVSQKHKVFSWSFQSDASSGPRAANSLHSLPVDPHALSPEEKKQASINGHFDVGVWISLFVGFICGVSITLFLVAVWAVIKRNTAENVEDVTPPAQLGYKKLVASDG